MSTISADGVFGNLGSDAIVLSGAGAFDFRAEGVQLTQLEESDHLRDNGGSAEIFFNANTILLEGISVSEIGVGLAYSADDFIF